MHRCQDLCSFRALWNASNELCWTLYAYYFHLQDWLNKFGYLPPPDPVTGQLQTKEALTKAIKAMQKFGGLKETGVLGMFSKIYSGLKCYLEVGSTPCYQNPNLMLLFILRRPSHIRVDENTEMLTAGYVSSRGDNAQKTKSNSSKQME